MSIAYYTCKHCGKAFPDVDDYVCCECGEHWMPDDFECIWSKETTTQINSKRNVNDENNIRIEKLFKLKEI